MSRYIVEWHVKGDIEVRSDSVEVDNHQVDDGVFRNIIAHEYGMPVSDVVIYMSLLQDEPRSPLNGRWGSFFKN